MVNNIKKLFSNAIPSALVGALLGLWIQEVVQAKFHEIPIDEIWILVISFLVMTIMITMIFVKLETVKEYQNRVLKDVIDGFVTIDREAISAFASSLVKDSKVVRVIGTARQEAIINNTSDKTFALNYLRTLEKRLEHNSEKHPFTYLRVIPNNPQEPLQKHIDKCMSLVHDTGHHFECIEIDPKNFDFIIAYQIFDDRHLLLIVDNKVLGRYNDNSLCLWTKNKKIIDAFSERFDDALIAAKR